MKNEICLYFASSNDILHRALLGVRYTLLMFEKTKLFDEKNIHFVFEVSLIFKAIFASLEILSGVLVYIISPTVLSRFLISLTESDLFDTKPDALVTYLTRTAESISIGSTHFAAFYLLSHGAVKLFLIIGLLRKKLWFYPASMLVFGIFIIYQLYRFSYTHSSWLLVLTVLDMLVIWLTWHEYNFLKRMKLWR